MNGIMAGPYKRKGGKNSNRGRRDQKPDAGAPHMPTEEEIKAKAKEIREQGFVDRYGKKQEPWGRFRLGNDGIGRDEDEKERERTTDE
jgi:hypothetical protein